MAFTPKDWKNSPDATTPINAEALEDIETRVSAYTDSITVKNTGNETIAGVKTFSSEPVVPSLKVDGLANATTDSRIVGATSGSAPTAGTWAVGDMVSDAVNGCWWVCSVAGTPGTWIRVGSPGTELGYVEKTDANFSTTSASLVDVTGLSKTVTVGTRPIIVEFGCYWLTINGALGIVAACISEGATTLQQFWFKNSNDTTERGTGVLERVRLTPSAGSHTYKITMLRATAGTGTLYVATSAPAWLQITEV